MELLAKQKWSIKRATKRINLWHGSVRASKTFGSIIWFIQQIAIAPNEGTIFLIGKTIGSLKRNIIDPMYDLLGHSMKYYPGKQEIHIWGRIISTIGANDERSEQKIRGVTCSLAYGDEVTLWPESFWLMLITRLSMDSSIFGGTTNPDNPNHYLKKDWINRESELNFRSFHFILDDNTTLSKQYIEDLKKMFTGLWYKRFILGEWCVAQGAIYDFFDENYNTLLKAPKADYYDVGIDHGTGNPTVFLLMGNSLSPGKPYIWCEDEYYYDSKKDQRQKTNQEYSDDLIHFLAPVTSSIDHIIERKYGQERLLSAKSARIKDRPLHNIYVDPSALAFKTRLVSDGFTGITDADNSVIDGIQVVSTMLKNGDYAILKSCTNNISEKYSYIWDEKRQAIGEDKPVKVHDHACDAERYVLYTKFGSKGMNYNNI